MMSSQEQPPIKKHCFTRGLMEQLKARTAIKRTHIHSSTLPVFVWESPPLAKIYRITFLARLEPDGEEGLGFRFDDTVSETPRQLAWGGTVGTADSPRCFLDGSQTFITESVAKASERCRRGWHVRVGKVSQIVQAFNNVQDSLVMKLSLRKLDSNTRVTNLVSQQPSPRNLQQSLEHNFQFPQPRMAAPSAPLVPSPPMLNPFASIRREVLLRSDTESAKNKHLLRPPTPPDTPPTTTTPITPPSPPTPPTPSSVTSDAFTSEENSNLPDDPTTDANNEATMPPPPLQDKDTSSPSQPITSLPDLNPSSAPAPANAVSPARRKLAPEEIEPISTDTPPVFAATVTATPEPASPSTQPAQSASNEVVCLVFPPTQRRPCVRTIYIRYSHLVSINYFKQALESSSSTSLITESSAPRVPSTQTLIRTIVALLGLVARPVLEGLAEFKKLLAPRSPKLIYRIEDIVVKLVPAVMRVGLGLSRVLISGCVAGTCLVLDEYVRFLESVVGEDSVDGDGHEDTRTTALLRSAQRLVRSTCANWPALRHRLAKVPVDALVDDGDSDDELESMLGVDDTVEPPSPGELKATFTITQIAYPTFRGLSDYIQLGAVNFAPLRSTFESKHALACQLTEAGIMRDLAQQFPARRRAYMEARSVTVAKDEGATGQVVSKTPCSPKSLYKLAERLGMDELKDFAKQQILRNLSPLNISHEIRLASKDRLVGLVQSYRETVTSALGIER